MDNEYYQFNEDNNQEPEVKNIENDERPNKKEALIGIILGIGYITILTVVPLYLIYLLFGRPYTDAESMLMSSGAQMITAFVVIVAMGFISRRVIKEIRLGFTFKALLRGLGYALLLYVAAIAVNLIMTILFGSTTTNANQTSINELMANYPIVGVLFTCVLAPVIEELIFRYYLFGALSKKNVALAFIVTALGFGLIHMLASFSSYASDGNLSSLLNDLKTLPDYVVAGLIFCWVYYKHKKIGYPIFAHMIYNTIATIIMLISIQNTPVLIQNVKTTDNTIYFDLRVQNSTLTKIELYEYKADADDELFAVMELPDSIYTDLSFTGLPNQSVYTIKITYEYETITIDESMRPISETHTSSITTHAKTRG